MKREEAKRKRGGFPFSAFHSLAKGPCAFGRDVSIASHNTSLHDAIVLIPLDIYLTIYSDVRHGRLLPVHDQRFSAFYFTLCNKNQMWWNSQVVTFPLLAITPLSAVYNLLSLRFILRIPFLLKSCLQVRRGFVRGVVWRWPPWNIWLVRLFPAWQFGFYVSVRLSLLRIANGKWPDSTHKKPSKKRLKSALLYRRTNHGGQRWWNTNSYPLVGVRHKGKTKKEKQKETTEALLEKTKKTCRSDDWMQDNDQRLLEKQKRK